jgi:hypothetical protein
MKAIPPYAEKIIGCAGLVVSITVGLGLAALLVQIAATNNTIVNVVHETEIDGYIIGEGLSLDDDARLSLDGIFSPYFFGTRNTHATAPSSSGPVGENEVIFGGYFVPPAAADGGMLQMVNRTPNWLPPPSLKYSQYVPSNLVSDTTGFFKGAGFSNETLVIGLKPINLAGLPAPYLWSFSVSAKENVVLTETGQIGSFLVDISSFIPEGYRRNEPSSTYAETFSGQSSGVRPNIDNWHGIPLTFDMTTKMETWPSESLRIVGHASRDAFAGTMMNLNVFGSLWVR